MPESKTDIRTGSLLMRYVPQAYRPYALLARLDRPIGFWLLALPGMWSIFLASGGLSFKALWMTVLFGVGAIAMRAAGCVVNDLWDRDLDRRVERTRGRPLASGVVSMKNAFIFLLLLLLTGLIVLIQMNGVTVLLGFISVPFVIAYPLMKRITWWPQAFLGLTINFGVLMGWSAMTEHLALSALLIYAGAFFWTIGYDTIYAHQDKSDDLMVGIKSTAIKFGAYGKQWVSGLYGLAFVSMTAGFMLQNPLFGVFMIPAGVHLVWQVRGWRMDDADSALAMFKSNRDTGLLVLAAAVAACLFETVMPLF